MFKSIDEYARINRASTTRPALKPALAAQPPAAGSVSDHRSRPSYRFLRRVAENGRRWRYSPSGRAGPPFFRHRGTGEYSSGGRRDAAPTILRLSRRSRPDPFHLRSIAKSWRNAFARGFPRHADGKDRISQRRPGRALGVAECSSLSSPRAIHDRRQHRAKNELSESLGGGSVPAGLRSGF